MGKTDVPGPVDFTLRKHPHARGEDAAKKKLPRITTGNTPTHVGKTALKASGVTRWGKHPHARGEDRSETTPAMHPQETPPRTWGRPELLQGGTYLFGNTPTHVGKTSFSPSVENNLWKHPHARGEDGAVVLALAWP